jgi:hypothetical protein
METILIGVLLICTGKYDQFVKSLLDSFEQNFLRGEKKKYYLFTDKDFVDSRVHHVKIERKGFPGDTLYRFHYFLSIKDLLVKETSCLYYSDVDMLCINNIGNEILPTEFNPLVGTAHPGYFMRGLGTPEDNQISTAFIRHDEYRPCYWAGGFSGGYTSRYLAMAESISKNIDIDSSKGHIAKWHDESHLNRYFTTHFNQVKTMNPSYCYSEKHCAGNVLITPRLVALDKNHAEVRS